jgi:hypothetical protein
MATTCQNMSGWIWNTVINPLVPGCICWSFYECMYLFTSSVALYRPFTVQEDRANSPAYKNPRMVKSSNADACHLWYEHSKNVNVQTVALHHSTLVRVSNSIFSTHLTQNWTPSYILIHKKLIFHSFLLFSSIRNLAMLKLKHHHSFPIPFSTFMLLHYLDCKLHIQFTNILITHYFWFSCFKNIFFKIFYSIFKCNKTKYNFFNKASKCYL